MEHTQVWTIEVMVHLVLLGVTIALAAISAVTVTNVGGYTIAYITLADINSAGGGSLSGAELDCIIEL